MGESRQVPKPRVPRNPLAYARAVTVAIPEWDESYCTWEEAQDGHTAVVECCKVCASQAGDHPLVVKAGVLAQRTLNKASQTAIAALIERSFKDHQPVK